MLIIFYFFFLTWKSFCLQPANSTVAALIPQVLLVAFIDSNHIRSWSSLYSIRCELWELWTATLTRWCWQTFNTVLFFFVIIKNRKVLSVSLYYRNRKIFSIWHHLHCRRDALILYFIFGTPKQDQHFSKTKVTVFKMAGWIKP